MANSIKNRQFQKTDKEIRRVFLELLKRNTIETITVSQICRLVGINRSSFYYHYLDIDDLLEKLSKEMNRELLHRVMLGGENFLSEKNLLVYLEHIKLHQNLYRFLNLSRLQFPFEEGYEDMVQYLAQQERFLATDKKSLAYAIVFIQAGFTFTIRQWLLQDCQEDEKIILKVLQSFLK